ncbi:YopX family protein [Paenibacillus humicus]|uniref:YopX family protein n=1 Tax=Paenibacillus humicus TaxID=412861 RepID=UPI000FD8472B|nr:YopX family protein [Paenibacillus humicus]
MGRDYKFRGQKHADGEWAFGSLVTADNGDTFIMTLSKGGIGYHSNSHAVDPETVGQYIRSDINGNAVFEDDIVKQPGPIFITGMGFKTETEMIGIVELRESVYRVRGKTNNSKLTDSPLYPVCEVIGNIHQHPELLKEGEG